MSTKHTPGPWFVVERYSGGLSVIDQRGFEHIDAKFFMPVFEVCPDKRRFPNWSDSPRLEISDEEQAANARLIAAAPDLLQSLKEVVDWLEIGDHESVMHINARAAIAKATGSAA